MMARGADHPFSEYVRGFDRPSKGRVYHAMIEMLESYFDDSADELKQRYCASGGFFGFSSLWDSFEIAWSNATYGLKKPFRSTDCEGGHGQFEGWPKLKRDELMVRLVDVIQAAHLAGFASIVPVGFYRSAFPSCANDDPHRLTIPHTIMNMAVLADRSDVNVNTWFELGGPKGFIGETFEAIKKMNWKPSRRLRGLAFDDKTLRPLQSADFIAREAFKHLENLGTRPMRKGLRRIGERVFFIAWTEESLKYLAAHGGPQNLELLAHWDETPDAPKLAWHSLWLSKRGRQ